jgi:hypothetical protein
MRDHMDKAHEKMWTSTKEYYEELLQSDASDLEKSWYERRVKSCDNLLSVFKIS